MKKGRSPLDQLPVAVRRLLRKSSQPAWLPPMLATLTDTPFSRAGWLFEPKWDGIRCLIFRDRRSVVRLISRNQKLLNDRLQRDDPGAEVLATYPDAKPNEAEVTRGANQWSRSWCARFRLPSA